MSDKLPCNCPDHLEKLLMDVLIPHKDPEQVFQLLFSDSFDFMVQTMKDDGDYDIECEPWSPTGTRSLKFKSPINVINPLITVKFAECYESVQIRTRQENRLYVVQSVVDCPNVPFGSYFTTNYQYCISKADSATRLLVHGGLPFRKYTMFESMIKKESLKNMQIYFDRVKRDVESLLSCECNNK